jgi:glycosyltransferase involved in cell wall biosynthesis
MRLEDDDRLLAGHRADRKKRCSDTVVLREEHELAIGISPSCNLERAGYLDPKPVERDPEGAAVLMNGNVDDMHGEPVADLVERERILRLHLDIVDESRIARDDARRKLGLPVDKQLVVYTGKIYDGYKEVEYIVEAARLLQARDVEFILVGGREDHNERLRRRVAEMGLDNVTFAGFVAPLLVQDYQFAADILVMYYPSDMELNRYRSPGKLFDYMASGRPIVSGDLTCVREVLGDEDPAALLIPEDSPEELARAIAALLDDPERAARLAENALERVRDYTWDARADRIIAFINEVAE